MDTYIISLPNSNRREIIRNYYYKHNIPIKFFDAISGDAIRNKEKVFNWLSKNHVKISNLKSPNLKIFDHTTYGQLAVFISHLFCIYNIFINDNIKNKNYMIIEDDCFFAFDKIKFTDLTKTIKQLQNEGDIFRLGWFLNIKDNKYIRNEDLIVSHEEYMNLNEKDRKVYEKTGFIKNYNNIIGALGYVLTYQGINKIGNYINNFLYENNVINLYPWDEWLIRQNENNLISFVFKLNLFIHNDNNKSEIKKFNTKIIKKNE